MFYKLNTHPSIFYQSIIFSIKQYMKTKNKIQIKSDSYNIYIIHKSQLPYQSDLIKHYIYLFITLNDL